MLHNTFTDTTNHMGGVIAGTVGGTIVSVAAIQPQSIVNTVILAGIGATTSFLVTMAIKYVWYKYIFPSKKEENK